MGRKKDSSRRKVDRYGIAEDCDNDDPVDMVEQTSYHLQPDSAENDGLINSTRSGSDNDSTADDDDSSDEEPEMSIEELLYSSSSYYAIAKPVSLTMVLAALAVVCVNNDTTRAQGEQAMASAYQVWHINDSGGSTGQTLALSLANALVMVTVICCMTFAIVLLYKLKCMKCLISYMMLCSGTLLGLLGGNMVQVAIQIYNIPVDKVTFFMLMYNFALVGVLSVFFGQGVPKYVTQAYLIATSVILAWHLSYFDDWTTWTLLFMLAIYDLCAVLTPCGPLKALVDLMSRDDSAPMPGLLFEADLPPEARRPGVPRNAANISSATTSCAGPNTPGHHESADPAASSRSRGEDGSTEDGSSDKPPEGPVIDIPLAVAKVYNLPVIVIPPQSRRIICPERSASASASPLLHDNESDGCPVLPENPTAKQLRAMVTVRLPLHGGRLEQVSRRGKKVFLERDRFGNPKRILWVDTSGKVFAEMRTDDEEGNENNSIRLGLGDFIFYSVLVAKAAQYSFATFAACMLVILAGLGGTLVLLSVYHHALPALPISIFLGVIFYLVTRLLIEPWIEAVLGQPYYV